MNCPSRPDEIEGHPDWNQNPWSLNSDATTRADLNGLVNRRALRDHDEGTTAEDLHQHSKLVNHDAVLGPSMVIGPSISLSSSDKKAARITDCPITIETVLSADSGDLSLATINARRPWHRRTTQKVFSSIIKYGKFIGPGFIIAVAYIDPGNYATDVSAGAQTQFAHLFIVLFSNLVAIFLQSLCIKLGSVTGLDLAQMCRIYMPRWAVWVLYVISECAIIATDVAEVIGTAIALNLLFHIPLTAGCAISIVDVFIILMFYRPDGSMTRLRFFEYFVMALVLGVMVCFCIELSYIRNTSIATIFRGYLPSAAIVEGNGVYLSCGILGATVMPHSIFLGSGLVQSRLKEYDENNITSDTPMNSTVVPTDPEIPRYNEDDGKYRPTIAAIRGCLRLSVIELASSLFTFALFVNSAILIVAGASLHGSAEAAQADLFGIHDLLVRTIAPAAGVLFALALLLSGTSAGIVCTMAGQMVSEGMVNWKLKPWKRRLLTRSISITPSIVIAGAVGQQGLNAALNWSQVALSVALPFVTAPLLYFTCRSKFMTVESDVYGRRCAGGGNKVNMKNGWIMTGLAICIWILLVVLNMALVILAGLGKS